MRIGWLKRIKDAGIPDAVVMALVAMQAPR
jgi:hypothetical protein